ncbi:MAG: nucleoside triphosphate pyrophosphatase [Myxococcota bacterium]
MAPQSPPLVLASGSTYKHGLMARLGYPFAVDPADIDEAPRAHERPRELAERLAEEKARHVAARHPGALVLGCDQVVALGEAVLHKPGTYARAVDQLMMLQGHTHDLFCAIALVSPAGDALRATAHYAMTMRTMTRAQVERYVREDAPLDCAGSYKLEHGGVRLFSSMLGDDYTAIVGLPLTRVHALLDEVGFVQAFEAEAHQRIQ